MELIAMVLVPFPLGWFIRTRLVAFVAWIAVHAFIFTFQSVELVLEWAGGDTTAFGPFPKADTGQTLGYGVVNLVIYALGFGLVLLGSRLADRRRRAAGAVNLESARA